MVGLAGPCLYHVNKRQLVLPKVQAVVAAALPLIKLQVHTCKKFAPYCKLSKRMGVPQLKYLKKKIKYLENLGAAYIAHLKGFWLPHSFHIKDADQLTQSYSQLLKYQVQCDILERKNETKHFS